MGESWLLGSFLLLCQRGNMEASYEHMVVWPGTAPMWHISVLFLNRLGYSMCQEVGDKAYLYLNATALVGNFGFAEICGS